MPSRRPALALAALLISAMAATGCTGDGGDPDDPGTASPTPTGTPDPAELTLGVYGSEDELVAWDAVVRGFNSVSDTIEVSLVEWANHTAADRAIRGGEVPDVFLANRQDLHHLLADRVTRPVSELLDERGVDFGDRFSRDAVESFSVEDELQCMPYSISPMVLYVNTDLVDFAKMERRGLDVPDRWDRWTLEEFTASAEFAARPARGSAGFHIEPSIEGLAPFVYSGGGTLFDDPISPTTLTFSADETRESLEQSLAVLRDASLTLTDEQLAKRTPLEWFERGQLGMIAGFRDLTPRLRLEQDLEFDVMPMPTLETSASVGDVTGLCLSADSKEAASAAALIAHLIDDSAVERVTRAGAMVPANLSVAASDAFLQPGRQPARARVFNSAVRGVVIAPLVSSWSDLEEAVAPGLTELLTAPGDLDLEAVTTSIDEASREVLDPELATEAPEE